MKKVYLVPNTLVVKVETQQMIAESVPVNETTTKSYNESLSRGGGDWEDE